MIIEGGDFLSFQDLLTLGPFPESPETFRPRKAVRLFRKAGLLILCKGDNIKITAKFRASRRLRFEDTKSIMSPENAPEKFRDFRGTVLW